MATTLRRRRRATAARRRLQTLELQGALEVQEDLAELIVVSGAIVSASYRLRRNGNSLLVFHDFIRERRDWHGRGKQYERRHPRYAPLASSAMLWAYERPHTGTRAFRHAGSEELGSHSARLSTSVML